MRKHLRLLVILFMMTAVIQPSKPIQAISRLGLPQRVPCINQSVAIANFFLKLCTATGSIAGYNATDGNPNTNTADIMLTAPIIGHVRPYLLRNGQVPQQFDQTLFQSVTTEAETLETLQQVYASSQLPSVGTPHITINGVQHTGKSFFSVIAAQPETTNITLVSYWAVQINNSLMIIELEEVLPENIDISLLLARYATLELTTSPATMLFLPLATRPTTGQKQPKAIISQADLPEPTWWDGVCNLNNYQPAMGLQSYSLGQGYRGVLACGPRPNVDFGNSSGNHLVRFFPGAWGEYEWQCVELVMRYMYIAYDTHPYSANGNEVYTNYSGQTGYELEKIVNGTQGKYPKPGDIISFSGGQYGHAAIVIEASVDANGNGFYKTLNQNSAQTIYTIQVTNWNAQAIGWLHDARTDVIPPVWPNPVPNRWRAEYRPTHNLTTPPSWIQLEDGIDKHWGTSAPYGPGWQLPADGFSVVWEGEFDFLAQAYTFVVKVDDQAKVLLDGQILLDTNLNTGNITRQISAGRHSLRVEYREQTGLADVAFYWSPVIPIADPSPLPQLNGDGYGYGVVSGDFNGDGLPDIASGAPGETLDGAVQSGAVYIHRGTITGTLPLQLLNQTGLGGTETGDLFGSSLAVGNFNNDAFDDLIVGSPGEQPGSDPRAGYVFVYKGSPTGLIAWHGIQQTPSTSNDADDRFGYALTVGDFDGNGTDDLAIGAPNNALGSTPRSGSVMIYRGGGVELAFWQHIDQANLGVPEAEDRFGSVLSSGDFNGDGKADLAVGAPGEIPDGNQSGHVFIYKGATTGLQPWQGLMQPPLGANEYNDRFGTSFAVGDLNQDGKDDLIVGTVGEAPGPHPASGYVFVFHGHVQTLQPAYGLDQQELGINEADDRFGFALALGDINGDSKPDLLVGAPGESPGSLPKSGYVFAFRNDNGVLVPWRGIEQSGLGGNEFDDRFGWSITTTDIDQNGFYDVIIGAPGEAPGGDPKSGYVFGYKGSLHGPIPWFGIDQHGLDTNE